MTIEHSIFVKVKMMSSCDDRRHFVPEVLRGGEGVIYIHTIDLGKLK